MDAEAKTRWQRAKPTGLVVGLPGFLVGGEWVGVSLSRSPTDPHLSCPRSKELYRLHVKR